MAKDPSGRPVVTADDLDRMTPQQVEDAWAASIVTDPDALPAEYVEQSGVAQSNVLRSATCPRPRENVLTCDMGRARCLLIMG